MRLCDLVCVIEKSHPELMCGVFRGFVLVVKREGESDHLVMEPDPLQSAVCANFKYYAQSFRSSQIKPVVGKVRCIFSRAT
jgi:hypothetical protein